MAEAAAEHEEQRDHEAEREEDRKSGRAIQGEHVDPATSGGRLLSGHRKDVQAVNEARRMRAAVMRTKVGIRDALRRFRATATDRPPSTTCWRDSSGWRGSRRMKADRPTTPFHGETAPPCRRGSIPADRCRRDSDTTRPGDMPAVPAETRAILVERDVPRRFRPRPKPDRLNEAVGSKFGYPDGTIEGGFRSGWRTADGDAVDAVREPPTKVIKRNHSGRRRAWQPASRARKFAPDVRAGWPGRHARHAPKCWRSSIRWLAMPLCMLLAGLGLHDGRGGSEKACADGVLLSDCA